MVSLEKIKKLREETGAGIADCRKALEESGEDLAKARELLKAWGIAKADKKAERSTCAGLIYSYIHHGGRVGVLLELTCETDFVARTDDFGMLCKELALQIASMDARDVDTLLKQEYIRDTSQSIEQLVKSIISKLGENIIIKRFVRFELGQS